jgi:dipeptidase E
MSPGSVPGLHAHPPFARELGGTLKLLLTSGGVTNPSIHSALVQLLGKPIGDAGALCIPTAEYGHPMCTPTSAWRFIAGRSPSPMCDLG